MGIIYGTSVVKFSRARLGTILCTGSRAQIRFLFCDFSPSTVIIPALLRYYSTIVYSFKFASKVNTNSKSPGNERVMKWTGGDLFEGSF